MGARMNYPGRRLVINSEMSPTPIVVYEYSERNPFAHEIWEESNSVVGIATACQRRANGFGTWVRGKCSVCADRRFFVAIYAKAKDLKCLIDGQQYTFSEGSQTKASLKVGGFGRREFTITQGECVLVSVRYRHWGGQDWPHDGDIFAHIVACTSSAEMMTKALSAGTSGVILGSRQFDQKADAQ